MNELPPAEVFFDSDCRNIYDAFYALYSDGEQVAPAGNAVISKLSDEGAPIDRVARLLLEESDSDEGGLSETLDKLLYRWRRQRQPALIREIRQAQQLEDQARLAELLEEKKTLSRSLHPGMTGKLW